MPDGNKGYVLYAVPGWGSVLTEAMLTWCGEPFRIEDVDGFDRPGVSRDRLIKVNPLAQVPTLILPDGMVMTESAAIALHLAEKHPDAELAPPPGSPERTAFLRWLIWMVANVYPTFTCSAYPERWAPADIQGLRTAADTHREDLWRLLEAETGLGPWVLGERFSALDIYVGAMSRWWPRRAWFEAHCPRLAGIARRTDELPKLAPVWSRNFHQANT